MAAYQSPVRRFSADFLSDKENTPSNEVNRLKSLLKSKTQIADASTNSDTDCAIHQNDNSKVIVKLKDGTRIKLCNSCATSNIVEDNSQKPPKRQRKPKVKAEKETNANDNNATTKSASLQKNAENESAKPKQKVTKSTKNNTNKMKTRGNKTFIEKNANDVQQLDENQETLQAVKKAAVKLPKRTIKKASKSEDTAKTQDENASIATTENFTNDQNVYEKQDTSVNDDNRSNLEKSVKKTRQRKGKKNNEDVNKNESQLKDQYRNDDSIDNDNSQLSDAHNKSDTINNTLENSTKAKRGKRNNNSTLQKQGNSSNTDNFSTLKETKEPSSSTVGERLNNISTHDSSFQNMEIHSTSLENDQSSNTSIHSNETIKNTQLMKGNSQASSGHDKSDTISNMEKNVTKRIREKTKEPSSSTVGERLNNISTHDSSFQNMEIHSTSLENNQSSNTSIHSNETIKNTQFMEGNGQATSGHDKSDTISNMEKKLTKRIREKKNKKEAVGIQKKVVNTTVEKNQVEQPDNSTVDERSDNVTTDEASFYNMHVHSTSLEDNVNTNNIYKDETMKINQPMQCMSFVATRVKKEPADIAENDLKNQANMIESPKKPSQYQLVVKTPESRKKKCQSKKIEQFCKAASSSSLKKGKADSSQHQKKRSSENKKKSYQKNKIDVKVAKAIQKMSLYYTNSKRGETLTKSDSSTDDSDSSSSSECSSSCSCYDESSSGDNCRCYNCIMQDSSEDSSLTETSTEKSDSSDYDSSSSSETHKCKSNRRRPCHRYDLRTR